MRRSGRPSAFSLVEMMIAMLLVLALLGLVATLMREYTRVSRHTSARENTMDGVQTALSAMAQELSGAQQVLIPTSGTSAAVSFLRVNPLTERFPPADEDSGIWSALPASSLMYVFYGVSNRQLARYSYSYDTWVTQSHVMATDIEGFQTAALSPTQYELALTFKETLRLKTFRTRVRIWCGL